MHFGHLCVASQQQLQLQLQSLKTKPLFELHNPLIHKQGIAHNIITANMNKHVQQLKLSSTSEIISLLQ